MAGADLGAVITIHCFNKHAPLMPQNFTAALTKNRMTDYVKEDGKRIYPAFWPAAMLYTRVPRT